MPAKHISDQEFDQEVLKSEVPVLVDFWAEWCGPCKIVGPYLEELADEYKDKFKIVKLNVDENPQTAQSHKVMSIPTMKIFKNGQAVDQIIGALPKSEIEKHIQAQLV